MEEKRSVGKPRLYDRDKIFSDLVEWAKLSDSINMCKFCANYEPPLAPSMMLLWARENPEYRQAYEIAKTHLGYRREEKLNKNELHVKAYDLNATTYDFFMKDEKRSEAEYLANLSKDIKNNLDEKEKEKYELLLDQFGRYQENLLKEVKKSKEQ